MARGLTVAPHAWGDHQWAVDRHADKSLASRVIRAVDEPDRIACLRFIPEVAASAQAFAALATPVTFLTLVRLDHGTWRGWGLGPALHAARDIDDDAWIRDPAAAGLGHETLIVSDRTAPDLPQSWR